MPSRQLSDAFRGHPVNLHLKDHLDFQSIREVPDSHAWPLTDEYYPSGKVDGYYDGSVPVIDLSDPNAAKLVGHACETWGAFQVVNHGISTSLLQDVEAQGKRLFSLPSEQKLKVARPPDGISGYGLARISSFFPKLMWSEGFTIVGSPVEHARQLWPHDYTNFCDVIEEYEKEVEKLSGRLIWLMLSSLGISKEDLTWAGPKGDFKGASAAVQLNSYPTCPDPDKAMGLAAHTDSTLLTVLYQNSTSGLQVLKDGSGWVTVPPLPGALVVNVGDLLHILSNGKYISVIHRAVVHRNKHRLSVAYLFGPPSNAEISPLSKLTDLKHPPIYRAVTWAEYLGIKAKHFSKALSKVRISQLPKEFDDDNMNQKSQDQQVVLKD